MTGTPYRHVVCAVDFSQTSRVAMIAAAELVVQFEGQLTLVHVYQNPMVGFLEAMPGSPVRASVADFAGHELNEWRRDAEDIVGRPVSAALREGVPWDQIVKLAREQRPDLLVVGTHGRTGLAHVLVGSVAERVLRHAPCPVLVVRERSG